MEKRIDQQEKVEHGWGIEQCVSVLGSKARTAVVSSSSDREVLSLIETMEGSGLDLGAGVDVMGHTLLMWAAHESRLGLLEWLLSRGVDPWAANRSGLTALAMAASSGQARSVLALDPWCIGRPDLWSMALVAAASSSKLMTADGGWEAATILARRSDESILVLARHVCSDRPGFNPGFVRILDAEMAVRERSEFDLVACQAGSGGQAGRL